ncbi:hypothetical protein CRUP_035510, partial [Coryphaenoides rupestris]
QNKVRRPEAPSLAAAEGPTGGLASPDTGQQPQGEQPPATPVEPQAAAAAAATGASPANSRTITTNNNNSGNNYNLVTSLLNLTRSPDGRIVVKACEGLMLLVSLPEPAAAKCLTENTELVGLLTDRLSAFYKALPQSMDPLDIETVESSAATIMARAEREAETPAGAARQPLRHRLIEHCDHLSDE